MANIDNFKGFGLFNDLEDVALQAYNRARMLVNMLEDNSDGKGNFNAKGVALTTGYMNAIPAGQRRATMDKFIEQMKKEGFVLVGSEAKINAAKEKAIG